MHMQRNWVSGVIFGLVFTAMLAACGSGEGGGEGGGATSTPSLAATSAEGRWTGTSSNGRSFSGAVLDDGTYAFLYSVVGQPDVVAGVLYGTRAESGQGVFTSSDGLDLLVEGLDVDAVSSRWNVYWVNLAARYVQRENLNGTLTYTDGSTVTVAATFAPEYDDTPDLTKIAGTYTGLVNYDSQTHINTVTVLPDGTFTIPPFTLLPYGGTAGPGAFKCGQTGVLSPRAHGNIYDLVFTNDAGGIICPRKTTHRGIAFFETATNRLYVLALMDATLYHVFPFMGIKQ